jgi:hypothetical protein
MPGAKRRKREIRDPSAVDIAAQSEQGGLLFVGGKESSRDHEATGSRPTVRVMLKLAHFPIATDRSVVQPRQKSLQGGDHAGNDGVFGGPRFQGIEDWIETEAGVGPHAQLAHIRRNFGKAPFEPVDAPVPGSRIAGTQFGIPEVRGVGLHAQERIVGAFAAISWVVANFSSMLMTKNGHHGAV